MKKKSTLETKSTTKLKENASQRELSGYRGKSNKFYMKSDLKITVSIF